MRTSFVGIVILILVLIINAEGRNYPSINLSLSFPIEFATRIVNPNFCPIGGLFIGHSPAEQALIELHSPRRHTPLAGGLDNRSLFSARLQYLILRGYDPTSSKLAILKRALIESWGQPGFHCFWRVWNPGIGYLLYCLYLFLGGKRVQPFATMLVFILCGILHDVLVKLIFWHPFIAFTATFFFFGILTIGGRSFQPILNQKTGQDYLMP